MTKSKIILIVAVAFAVVAAVQIQQHTEGKLRENDDNLQQQNAQLAELTAEASRLSNLVTQTKSTTAPADDRTVELEKLRTKAETLRQQTHQLAKQLAENRLSAGEQIFASGDFNLLEHNDESDGSMAGGPRASGNGKLNDARAFTAALNKYAEENRSLIPKTLDQVTLYLPKPLEGDSPEWVDAPPTGTNAFEIVYQGSLNELTNIPLRRVALIREQQPWLTKDGKFARVYGLADGSAVTVESDDAFQSWEAQHIIPAPAGR